MSNRWMLVPKLSRRWRLGAALALCLAAPAGWATSELQRVVDGYVSEALNSNLALQQRELSVAQAQSALAEARAMS